MLGLDIARYQEVTDWNAVKQHGVRFIWVKGTDGGGPAPVQRADGQVAGSRSVGIPVGIYHYAQLSPSPEAQADVLAAEHRRLEARYGPLLVPPALDLEKPHSPGSVAATFARRFLVRLKAHGFNRVMLYANTSMLTGIRADDIRRDIPGVGIWAARYGANDGRNNGLGGYGGWVDVHQYASVGRVPGIRASGVDLNEAANLAWMNGADDVELTDKVRWGDGHEVMVKDILAEAYIAARGLRGASAFDGEPGVVQLPPLVAIKTGVDGLGDDEAKVIAEMRATKGDLLIAMASIDGSWSEEEAADLAAMLNVHLAGAYTVSITPAPTVPDEEA
jgi:GH25 family lysozyme M1 (1,4-beta-N-acetylmuramidase)